MVQQVGEADVGEWAQGLDALHERIAPRFFRREPRARVLAYLRGLLGAGERKNGWCLAEAAGERTPDGMQRLLGDAEWDADGVRDDLRGYVVEHMGDESATLIVDETGFHKKGTKSVGVKRQYSGTAGRVENCQIGVFLAYAGAQGRAFLDRELYLPAEWADDIERRREAGVPEGVEFATKPELARRMIERALAAEVPAAWVTGDEVYGANGELRSWLEGRGQAYVLAVASRQRVFEGSEQRVSEDSERCRADELAGAVPATAWSRLSAGDGEKGPRLYDWARTRLDCPVEGWGRWLLVRRSLADTTDLAYYMAFGPADTSIEELVRVAGARWAIEECFEAAKGEVGLDEYEVRRWDGWYRHITLSLLAHAYLSVTRHYVAEADGPSGKGGR